MNYDLKVKWHFNEFDILNGTFYVKVFSRLHQINRSILSKIVYQIHESFPQVVSWNNDGCRKTSDQYIYRWFFGDGDCIFDKDVVFVAFHLPYRHRMTSYLMNSFLFLPKKVLVSYTSND